MTNPPTGFPSIHVTVAALAHRSGRYLLVEERICGTCVINQPAGHLEIGEPLRDAVVRETLEETAHHFVPEGLVGIYRWRNPHTGDTYLRTTFFGTIAGQESGRKLDAGIVGTRWMSRRELEANRSRLRSPMVLRCVNDFENGTRHSLSVIHELD